MTELEKLNKELTQKLQQLEIAHKHCVNFMGKAFIEESRDRLNAGVYFHEDFTKKVLEINKLVKKQQELLLPAHVLKTKYDM